MEEDQPKSPKRRKIEQPSYQNVIRNACVSNPKTEGPIPGPTLRKAVLRQMFEVASSQETRDSNRRKMYAVWKEGTDDDAG